MRQRSAMNARAPALGRALKAAALAITLAGAALPVLRRRAHLPAAVVLPGAAAAPLALSAAVPRTRTRDILVCTLQMWAYVTAYKMPHDDPAALERRVRVDYPMVIDRVLGLGALPTVRLQRALARSDRWRLLDRVLVWTHWAWFPVPHAALLYLMLRRPERFVRAALMTYAVFDLGAIVYWTLPTAPPWYAPVGGRSPHDGPAVRRMMAEYGEYFWRDRWRPLYSVLGGNPLAAMPSLHFATSLMAASLLGEAGAVEGAVGWSYAGALGFALVYLGEHYVVDLVAGAALTMAVRRGSRRAGPVVARLGQARARLEALVQG